MTTRNRRNYLCRAETGKLIRSWWPNLTWFHFKFLSKNSRNCFTSRDFAHSQLLGKYLSFTIRLKRSSIFIAFLSLINFFQVFTRYANTFDNCHSMTYLHWPPCPSAASLRRWGSSSEIRRWCDSIPTGFAAKWSRKKKKKMFMTRRQTKNKSARLTE